MREQMLERDLRFDQPQHRLARGRIEAVQHLEVRELREEPRNRFVDPVRGPDSAERDPGVEGERQPAEFSSIHMRYLTALYWFGSESDKQGDKSVHRSILITLAALGAALSLPAQTSSAIAEAKQAYAGIKNNLTKAADKMPEENYGFKPVAEIRNFGQEVAHVADAQLRTCSTLNGEAKTPNEIGRAHV